MIEYPQYLDDEDMDLALKEWKLSGFHIDSGESNRGLRYIDVSHPDDGVDQITDAPGAYVQRKDGYWILVPHERYPAWKDAVEFAEAYDVGS